MRRLIWKLRFAAELRRMTGGSLWRCWLSAEIFIDLTGEECVKWCPYDAAWEEFQSLDDSCR